MAGNVIGNSSIVYDTANNKVKGISKTILDYETAAYYSAYVCGELFKDGVSQVRSCHSGLITATVNTQFTGIAYGSVLSDHYVDMQYYDEGYGSYIDYEGYQFTSPGYYPGEMEIIPAGTLAYYPTSIYLGDTYFQKPYLKLTNPRFDPTTVTSISGSSPHATTAKLTITASVACADSTCFHTGDYAVVEFPPEFTESYFDRTPETRNVILALNGAVDATFDVTVHNDVPVGTYKFSFHIIDVRRGSDNTSILSTVQLNPTSGEQEVTLQVTH